MVKIHNDRARLVLGGNTSMNDAADFLAKAGGKDKGVYGKTDKNGVTTLYLKKGSSIFEGAEKRATKQQAGRDGLQSILTAFERQNSSRGLSRRGGQANADLFQSLRKGLAGAGSLRSAAAGQTFGARQDIEEIAAKIPEGPAPAGLPGGTSSMARIDGRRLDAALQKATAEFAGGDAARASELVQAGVEDAVISKFSSRAARMDFAIQDPAQLKSDLVRDLTARLATDHPGAGRDEDLLSAAVNKAVDTALETFCGVSVGDGPTVNLFDNNGLELPFQPIVWNGQTYKPDRFLAAGGFGRVYQFVSIDDPGKKLAMKVPYDENNRGLDEHILRPDQKVKFQNLAREEIATHLKAEGSGHDNILPMAGAVRLPTGNIGIVMEFAELGSMEDLHIGLQHRGIVASDAPPQSGQITKAEKDLVALTLVSDMLKGADHMHRRQDVVNLDTKSANALIMGDGTVVMADFGTTRDDGVQAGDLPDVEAVQFKAPEFHQAVQTFDRLGRQNEAALQQSFGAVLPKDAFRSIGVSIAEADPANASISTKADVWSIGVTLAQLTTGQVVNGHSDLDTFIAGNGPAVGDGTLFTSLGSPALDALANRLLDRDPTRRASASQALADPALQAPGVGTPEARDLIKALVQMTRAKDKNDAAAIALAQTAVDGARAALATRTATPPTPPTAPPSAPFQAPTFRTSVNMGTGAGPAQRFDDASAVVDDGMSIEDFISNVQLNSRPV